LFCEAKSESYDEERDFDLLVLRSTVNIIT
jgi:hypothetical protein